MAIDRRQFLKLSALGGGAVLASSLPGCSTAAGASLAAAPCGPRRVEGSAGRKRASCSCCSVSVAYWPGQRGVTRPLTS